MQKVDSKYPSLSLFCVLSAGTKRINVDGFIRVLKRRKDIRPTSFFIYGPRLHDSDSPFLTTRASQYPWEDITVQSDLIDIDYVGFFDEAFFVSEGALEKVEQTLQKNVRIDILYADEFIQTGKGRRAYYKPDWSPNLHLSTPYIGSFAVIRRSIFKNCGGIRTKYRDYELHDLILRSSEQAKLIYHIPEIVTTRFTDCDSGPQETLTACIKETLARRNVDASAVSGLQKKSVRVLYAVRTSPLVSIIIPTKNHYRILKNCLDSVFQKTQYPRFEILIIDNGTTDHDAIGYIAGLQKSGKVCVIFYPQPYNFSAMNNLASKSARGEYLVFLNDDTEIISCDWISAILEHAQRPEIGVVGVKLLYPDKTIQHAGVVVGPSEMTTGCEIATHWQKHIPNASEGYFGYAHFVRDVSAVTAACMMVRKEVFKKMGGFDEELAVDFNDVDFCLRVKAQGFGVLYTPYSILIHHESKNRSRWDQTQVKNILMKEILYMQHKWRNLLTYDPFYNINLVSSKSLLPSKLFTFLTFVKRYGFLQTVRMTVQYGTARLKGEIRSIRSFLNRACNRVGTERKILFICFSLSDLSVQYRVKHIAEYFSHIGFSSEVIAEEQARWYSGRTHDFSSIILFRVKPSESIGRIISEAKNNKIPILYSSDDAVFLSEYVSFFPLPPSLRTERNLLHYQEEAIKRAFVLRMCDSFLASTAYLARLGNEKGIKSFVIKNGFGAEQIRRAEKAYVGKKKNRQNNHVVIGYVSGTKTHEADFAVIEHVIARLLSEYPKLHFRIVGHLDIPDILLQYNSQVERVSFCEWTHILDQIVLFDINIAPFEATNLFVQAKSEVKYIEAALVRVPTIASPIESYCTAIRQGENGLIASTDQDWYDSLRRLIVDIPFRNMLGDAAYRDVIDRYTPRAMASEVQTTFSFLYS